MSRFLAVMIPAMQNPVRATRRPVSFPGEFRPASILNLPPLLLAVPILRLAVLTLLLVVPFPHAGVLLAAPPATRDLGLFRITYYHVALESPAAQPDEAGWPVYAPDCAKVLAHTSRTFHHALSLEGTGLLRDGRLLNFESRCDCARPGYKSLRTCYVELDRTLFPWGRGAALNGRFLPLRPFISVAVDPRVIPLGTWIYVRRLRGLTTPDGQQLDGCFRAEDTGHNIKGRWLDLFTGLPEHTRWLQRRLRLERVRVAVNAPQCLERAG